MTKIVNTAADAELRSLIEKNQLLVQKLNAHPATPAQIRQQVATITGQSIDESTEIRLPFYTDYGRNIHIGKGVFINNGATFTDMGGIEIQDGALIGPNANLISVNHPLEAAKRHLVELKKVIIGQNAWVGANALVLPGVTVGKNAVVAAGAVVTHDVPDNTVVAGVPARIIKHIGKDD